MNYYYWESEIGNSGNVFAESAQEASEQVEAYFGERCVGIELIREDVVMNRFTGEIYYTPVYGE